MTECADDSRHDAARRRAVPRSRAQRRGQAADRASARAPQGRRHRSRLPAQLPGRFRRGEGDRRAGRGRGDRGALALFRGRRPRLRGGARASRSRADPRVHRHLADPSRGSAAHDAARGARPSRGHDDAREDLPRGRRVLPDGCEPHRARISRRGRQQLHRGRRDHHQPARHRRLRDARRVARPDRVDVRAGAGASQRGALRALPQRPRSRDRQLPGQRARRRAADRDLRQRHRRARRQCRARGGGHGHPAAPGGVWRGHAARPLAAVSHLAARLAAHRHARAAQQGRGGRQRVRAPLGHPPGRHAQGPAHLRDHGAGSGRCGIEPGARQAERTSRASRPARAVGLPPRRRGVAAGLCALQGTRGSQAGCDRSRPRGDRRR